MQSGKTIFLLAAVLCAVFPWAARAENMPDVRMMVAENVLSSAVRIEGRFSVLDEQNRVLLRGRDMPSAAVQADGDSIRMGKRSLRSRKILLDAENGPIQVFGATYSPRMEISANARGRITLVSLMNIEEYTRGVLQREMDPSWPLEVLKAQAILARTNAVYALSKNTNRSFHVTHKSPQVYQHTRQSEAIIEEAVAQTRGLILKYQERIIPAYFHSVCGGGTEIACNVWPFSESYPASAYCRYCKDAPKYRWLRKMSVKTFEEKLTGAGMRVPRITEVFANKLSAVSDRITEILIRHADGTTILRTSTLRTILGYEDFPSTSFTVEKDSDNLIFRGHGWGHGVGLCQWGARGMAEKGKSYREILDFYYVGARVETMGSPS